MSCMKPVLGYPSITAAAVALEAEGLRVSEIARRLGSRTHNISSLLCWAAKRDGKRRQRYRIRDDGGRQYVSVPASMLAALEPHAGKRGISPQALMRRLVATALGDGMIDGILDDGGA
jgi:hypothetical protein